MLNDLPDAGGKVIVGPNGSDDVTAYIERRRHARDGRLGNHIPIKIPSYTTPYLDNAYLYATNGLDNNLIRNQKANDGTSNRDLGVSLIGNRDAWLDGNDTNQDVEISDALQSGVHFQSEIPQNI